MIRAETAVVAKRADEQPIDTAEIRALAGAAGHAVVDAVTQARPADPGTYLGAGGVEALSAAVEAADADAVIVDDRLTPGQHARLRAALPPGTVVRDRYRLVLDIFAAGATTERAQLQVELARLRYELPRIEAEADEGMLNPRTEKGSRVYDVRDRIDDLRRRLDELTAPAEQFRARRREAGFDLVTIAGYTNAGKSTLLGRLADDLGVADTTAEHPDREPAVAAADRLFETLETTTRRATMDGRPVLCTDTVGFVEDLPHELVESFGETLSEASAADAVVLVADASEPAEVLRPKLEVALDVLAAQGVDRADVVTALNKADRLDPDERRARRDAVGELAPEPIPVSAVAGDGIESLRAAVLERLPTGQATLTLPNGDAAMRLLSRAYDDAAVEAVHYEGSEVRFTVRGRPAVVEQVRAAGESIAVPEE